MIQQSEFDTDCKVTWDEVETKPPNVECLQSAMLELWQLGDD